VICTGASEVHPPVFAMGLTGLTGLEFGVYTRDGRLTHDCCCWGSGTTLTLGSTYTGSTYTGSSIMTGSSTMTTGGGGGSSTT
jgi:hypothetical protein